MTTNQLREEISNVLVKWRIPTRQVAISEIMQKVAEHDRYVIGDNEEIIQVRKPTHGNCCTCQRCGMHHDECQCFEKEERNEWRDEARKRAGI